MYQEHKNSYIYKGLMRKHNARNRETWILFWSFALAEMLKNIIGSCQRISAWPSQQIIAISVNQQETVYVQQRQLHLWPATNDYVEAIIQGVKKADHWKLFCQKWTKQETKQCSQTLRCNGFLAKLHCKQSSLDAQEILLYLFLVALLPAAVECECENDENWSVDKCYLLDS